jgi:phospholipid/cholesterol/gamma-HCH transport system permease protein
VSAAGPLAVPEARLTPAEVSHQRFEEPLMAEAGRDHALALTVLSVFLFNVLVVEFGAADLSGAGASITTVNEIGPLVTADLGTRTIREEIDALRRHGYRSRTCAAGAQIACRHADLVAGHVDRSGRRVRVRCVLPARHPDSLVASMTLVTGLGDVVVAMVNATVFGLVGIHQGTTVCGGPAGVGNAVNQTVVYSIVLLFFINVILTAVGYQVTR